MPKTNPEMDLLRCLMAINAPTLDVDGVNRAQAVVEDRLGRLGFQVRRERGQARFGDLLVAEIPGYTNRWITLVTHVDTVLAGEAPFRIDGTRAFGVGVIDNKGGLAVGLSALKLALGAGAPLKYGVRFVSSPNEEMGSVGFNQRLRDFGTSTEFGLGLEPALDDGSFIHQRRGNRWYDVEVMGREAHAGRSYGRHANAAHDLAAKIVRLARLTNYRKHLSISVGAIEGGRDRHNVVCGEARLKLDVRFPDFRERERLHRRITRVLSRSFEISTDRQHRTHTTFTVVDDCPPFGATRRAKRVAKIYAGLAGQIEGRRVSSRLAGGAGDVNYLSTEDNVVLDGFGPIGGEMHTAREFMEVESLATRTRALAGFIDRLQRL